jgi:hypothetical protein
MPLRKSDRRPAAAAAELAMLMPFLMFLCVIATDWARLFYYTVTVEACARNGALYACDPVAQAQSPYTSVQQAALAEAPTLNTTATVTSANTTDAAGNPAVLVTVSVPFKTLTNFPGMPSAQTLTRRVQMRAAPTTTR